MSWTYSGNPANSKLDECRFLISDTVESAPIMQDEEIQYIIDSSTGNTNQLYYQLFSRAATIFSRDIKRRLGPQSEDPTERLKYFSNQAAYYQKKLTAAGLSLPKNAYPRIFRKGMQSNPIWPGGGDYLV